MRKLMWFTLGFAGACALCAYLLSTPWAVALAVTSGIGCLPFLLMKSNRAKITRAVLLGLTVGILWSLVYNATTVNKAKEYDGKTMYAIVEVTDYGKNGHCEGTVTLNEKKYKAVIYADNADALKPGDSISAVYGFCYTGQGGSKQASYYSCDGIYLIAYAQKDECVMNSPSVPLKYAGRRLAHAISDVLTSVFPEDTLAFAKALLLGDSDDLSYGDDTALKISGIRHVVAVSGMHVSILFALIYSFCGKHRIVSSVLGIPILVLFAAVAGFTPSVVRACVMQCMMLVALLLNREYDPPTALSFSVLLLLCINPLAVTSVSLQLSALCMVGIFLFCGRIQDFLFEKTFFKRGKGKGIVCKMLRGTASCISVSCSAMVFTIPLCAAYFGMVSIFSIVTNLLCLWVVTGIFYGVVLSLLAGCIWLPLGKIAAWVVSWGIRYVLFVCRLIAGLPGVAAYVQNAYVVMAICAVYVLLTLFFMGRRKHKRIFLGCCAACILISAIFSLIEQSADDYRITAVDVGQGQCIILQNQSQCFVVDCGGDSGKNAATEALQTLHNQGVYHLDGLIVTHYDYDHVGGAAKLAEAITTDRIYLPDYDADNRYRRELEQAYSDKITFVSSETVCDLTDGALHIYPSTEENEDNECCLCILFSVGDFDALITGDRDMTGEQELLESAALPDIELLVVGHHGSKTSTGMDLLRATRPEIAVISVGEDNSYGHPTKEALARLRLFGCRIWRTDQNGTLTFRG